MPENLRIAGILKNPWLTLGVSVLAITLLTLLLLWKPGRRNFGDGEGILVFYCAAGMRLPVDAVIERYRNEYGGDVIPEYGGSGKLLSALRVENDTPRADLYLAADESYIQEAKRLGLVSESIPIALMQPVLAVPGSSKKGIRSVKDLIRDDVKVVLANPEFAAIGRTSRKLLEEAGLWQEIEKRRRGFQATVSLVGTVIEVANNLKLDTADVGIIWDATAKQYPELKVVKVVEDSLLANFTKAVTVGIVSKIPQPAAALRFARYLTACDRGLEDFQRMGWEVVEGDIWEEEPELIFYSGGINRLAIEKTVSEFEAREGVQVTVKYGGCGILVSDMKAIAKGTIPSAFPDVYFACDASFVPPVEEQFLEPLEISETEIVLLVPKGNPKNIRTLRDLARPGIRVAMANEEHSALGALAKRLLEAEGLYPAVKENVTYQAPSADPLVLRMVGGNLGGELGEDVAIVYMANCSKVKESLDVIPIGINEFPLARAVQPYAVAKNSKHKHLAERLRSAILTSTSQGRFESAGFRWRIETR